MWHKAEWMGRPIKMHTVSRLSEKKKIFKNVPERFIELLKILIKVFVYKFWKITNQDKSDWLVMLFF